MQSIKKLISVSWTEGIILFLVFTYLLALAFFPFVAQTTGIQAYTDHLYETSFSTNRDIQALQMSLNTSEFMGDATVFIVWALVGLLAYFLLEAILHIFSDTYQFLGVLSYFKRNRVQLEIEGATRLLVSAVAVSVGAMTLYLGQQHLLPFILHAIDAGASGWLTAIAGGTGVVVYSHFCVILLRVALLRYRVFRNPYT